MKEETKTKNYGNQHTYLNIAEIENDERKILKNQRRIEKNFHDLLFNLKNQATQNYLEYVEWLKETDKYMKYGDFPPEKEYKDLLGRTRDLLQKLKTFKFTKNNKKAINEYYKYYQIQPPALPNDFQDDYKDIIASNPKIYETYPAYWNTKFKGKINEFKNKNLEVVYNWIAEMEEFLKNLSKAATRDEIDKLHDTTLAQVYPKTLVPGDCWQRLLNILAAISTTLTGFVK